MKVTGILVNTSCCTASAAGAKMSLSAANMTLIVAEAHVNTCTASAPGKSASASLLNSSTTLACSRLDAGDSATGTSASVSVGIESRLSGV